MNNELRGIELLMQENKALLKRVHELQTELDREESYKDALEQAEKRVEELESEIMLITAPHEAGGGAYVAIRQRAKKAEAMNASMHRSHIEEVEDYRKIIRKAESSLADRKADLIKLTNMLYDTKEVLELYATNHPIIDKIEKVLD